MADCNQQQLLFPRSRGRVVEALFAGGDITSNGGVWQLRQADRILGIAPRPQNRLSLRNNPLTKPLNSADCDRLGTVTNP